MKAKMKNPQKTLKLLKGLNPKTPNSANPEQGGRGNMSPPPLKYRGTSYVLVPPKFYHNIYFDWLVPPIYKIVPAPLLISNVKLVSLLRVREMCGADSSCKEHTCTTVSYYQCVDTAAYR